MAKPKGERLKFTRSSPKGRCRSRGTRIQVSTNDDRKNEGEYIPASTKVTLKDLAKHGIHRTHHANDKKGKKAVAQNVAIGASIVGGTAATTVGVIAASTSATGAISAAGATIGGVAGGVFGSGVGLATGGVGMAATVPFATAGAAIGGWAGPALALVGIGTAPAWAVPVAIGGGVVAIGGVATAIYKYAKSRAQKGKA